MCTNDELRDELFKKVDQEVKAFDKGFRHLSNRIDNQGTQLGKVSSDVHDAMMDARETKTAVGGMKELLTLWHKEDREERKDIWGEIDALKAHKNKAIGIALGISATISGAVGFAFWLIEHA